MNTDKTLQFIKDYVTSTYFLYKVCEGCDTVVGYGEIFCPHCDAYNFNHESRTIRGRMEEQLKNNKEYIHGMLSIDT